MPEGGLQAPSRCGRANNLTALGIVSCQIGHLHIVGASRNHPVQPTFAKFAVDWKLCLVPGTGSDGASQLFMYSGDRCQRYAYSDIWNPRGTLVLWIMLNPGTGETESRRRNTRERCKSWSRDWGHGGLLIGNLFSQRTKASKNLKGAANATDPLNRKAIVMLCGLSSEIVVAWGSGVRYAPSAVNQLPELKDAKCLGMTKHGQPRHPLYVPSSVRPMPWAPNTHVVGDA
ncbi:MAG: DUF1643 domain-containing protein [Terriglobia bacterium]